VTVQLAALEAQVRAAGHTVLTPLISLDTPGKATVQVVILADPVRTVLRALVAHAHSPTLPAPVLQDGYEICFVGEEAFRELSQVRCSARFILLPGKTAWGVRPTLPSVALPQVDPSSDSALEAAMATDNSDEWHAKWTARKAAAATAAAAAAAAAATQ
jgi:hypothetical protein